MLNRPKAAPAAGSMEMMSANRFRHYYQITNKRELNKAFAHVLREAYDLVAPKSEVALT